MAGKPVTEQINALAHEEHEIFAREARGEATQDDRDRLAEIAVELDQCWDLLHQRRALQNAGANPDQAEVRDKDTVEGYLS